MHNETLIIYIVRAGISSKEDLDIDPTSMAIWHIINNNGTSNR